jgi:ADP-ribosylglycohydrolase
MNKDILYGVIFGQAIGDAVGYHTEFYSEYQVKKLYPTRESFTFPVSIENSLMRKNTNDESDWTDDTDHLILLMEMLTENNNKINPQCFAKKLKKWVRSGIEELGDNVGEGCGMLTGSVVSVPGFEKDPFVASKQVWNNYIASNGSVMRTAIMACRNISYKDTIKESIRMSKCTHYDPRCSVASAVITSIIWDIINKTPENKILRRARKICMYHKGEYRDLTGELKTYDTECLKYFDVETLDELDLNKQIGYTLKCMACGIWAFKNRHRQYKEVILDIILKGGDADTNAAVAGAILGATIGYESLPQDWLNAMPHNKWLISKIDEYFKIVQV